ncbi:hypothetical protein NLX83_39345 [Allokutzneria sp. A3M-2-11 16]|uniref:hypothetical protein n=1 Tax=Allokutzneria sp. A3M-2-11 16 TaxID=2962043 RepID=UPI0020B68784|nr:hypothetical protein [Allokutzneria sp. A3M-2-11 16]MCP3805339.1 hypothetical protein [Allokutzneria sp. A3M-2-11 16]
MSSDDSWDRLLDDREAAAARFFEDLDDDPADDLVHVLDHAILDAAQRMDPGAGYSPWLDVHVEGPDVGFGSLDVHVVHELLGPLQAEIDAALPDTAKNDLTRMELIGIGGGSAVLRLHPKVATREFDGGIDGVSSVVDSAVRKVLDVHDALENQLNPAAITQLSQPELINKLNKLISVLDNRDLTLELLWRSPTSPRRSSKLTRTGRSYARELLESRLEQHERTIAGYIYEQSLRGTVKLKANPSNKRSATYEVSVNPEILARLEFRLRNYVQMRVVEIRHRNRLGQLTEATYSFISLVAHEDQLDTE